MQRALIVTGVLGTGTAVVFGAAGLAAMLFPNGTQLAAPWGGQLVDGGGWVAPGAIPVPGPGLAPIPRVAPAPIIEPGVSGADLRLQITNPDAP